MGIIIGSKTGNIFSAVSMSTGESGNQITTLTDSSAGLKINFPAWWKSYDLPGRQGYYLLNQNDPSATIGISCGKQSGESLRQLTEQDSLITAHEAGMTDIEIRYSQANTGSTMAVISFESPEIEMGFLMYWIIIFGTNQEMCMQCFL